MKDLEVYFALAKAAKVEQSERSVAHQGQDQSHRAVAVIRKPDLVAEVAFGRIVARYTSVEVRDDLRIFRVGVKWSDAYCWKLEGDEEVGLVL